MGNVGDIRPGMKFGTYNATFGKLEKRSTPKVDNQNTFTCSNSYQFFDKDKLVATMESGIIYRNEHQKSHKLAYVKMGSYTIGAEEPVNNNGKQLNKLDFFIGSDHHAVDINGDGTVGSDEIFPGKINYEAYLRAKSEGDIKKYLKYKSNVK